MLATMTEIEDYPINYHHELVSVLYNQELKEHLDDIQSLQNRFQEDGKEYRDMKRFFQFTKVLILKDLF